MTEIWVPVKGWEGLYEISNLKRVRVVPRRVRMLGGKYVKLKPRILKITQYNSVRLQAEGRKKRINLNELFKEHFPDEWVEPPKTSTKHKLITFNGKTQNITKWAAELGLNRKTLSNRLNKGWPVGYALMKPPERW